MTQYSKRDTASELKDYIQNHQVINTHSHHLPDNHFRDYTLDNLLRRSYVDWCGVKFDNTGSSRSAYLEKVRYKSYFVWLQKSLNELYGFEASLSADNWE